MKRLALGAAVVLMAGAAVWADGPKVEKAKNLVNRAYPVGDLVLTPLQQAERAAEPPPINGVGFTRVCPDYQPLIKLLTASVAPDTWTNEFGKDDRVAAMTPFYLGDTLIIRNTQEVHDQIAEKLRELRKLRALQHADKSR